MHLVPQFKFSGEEEFEPFYDAFRLNSRVFKWYKKDQAETVDFKDKAKDVLTQWMTIGKTTLMK